MGHRPQLYAVLASNDHAASASTCVPARRRRTRCRSNRHLEQRPCPGGSPARLRGALCVLHTEATQSNNPHRCIGARRWLEAWCVCVQYEPSPWRRIDRRSCFSTRCLHDARKLRCIVRGYTHGLVVDVILPQVAYRVVDKRLERALDRMGVHYVPPECSDVDASKGLPGV